MTRSIPASLAKTLFAGAFALVVSTTPILVPAAQAAATDEQQVVDRARLAVDDVKKDKEFGNAAQLARQARAIMIVPRLFKAGFFFGGEGGDAVMLVRGANGWAGPVFYTLASASFGLQIGAQESEVMLFIMNDKALNAVMRDQFKVGANAGIAVATLGSTAEAATTAATGADIVVWSSSTGAYAGISLNGSVIKPRASYNRAYYGHPVTARDIVSHGSANGGASGLVAALGTLG